MFTNSKDLLNILLGVSVLVVAVSLSVLFYNLVVIIRNFRQISKSVRDKIDLIDGLLKTSKDILRTFQDKLEHSTAYIGILIDLVTKIADHMKTRKKEYHEDNGTLEGKS